MNRLKGFSILMAVVALMSAYGYSQQTGGGQGSSGSGTLTSVNAGNGLTGGPITTTGTLAELYPVDASLGYVSGDPCATIATNITAALLITPSIDVNLSGFASKFANGIVPCQSNPFENQVFSGDVYLGPTQFVKSVPWVTPGNNQRVTIHGDGTADPGVAIALTNSTITDCDSDAPGWNGTACVIGGVTVAAFPSTGHCIAFTYPHGAFGAGTYCPSLWLGGMGAAGVTFGGSFGSVIKDFNIQSGAGGGNFGVYSAGIQEQSYCQNVVVRASNNSAFFYDKVQGNASGPGHFTMNGCTGRMALTDTAAQGYPTVANQVGMGYGIFFEGNGIVVYFTGGTCTTYPQGYPTTIAAGAVTVIKMTYAGSCSNVTGLTCHVGTAHGGSGETCAATTSVNTVTGITAGGVGTGYSIGDTQTGAPFEISNATINGKNTASMQEGLVLDGVFNPYVHSIHTGYDAGYGLHIGYGSGSITGGVFSDNDLENTSNGVLRLGVGIDFNQLVLYTGKGGSVNSIQDDNTTGPTGLPCSDSQGPSQPTALFEPCGLAIENAGLLDQNQAPWIQQTATANAVDGITVANAATANPATVTVSATGTDSNINIDPCIPKGSGTCQLGSANAAVTAAGALSDVTETITTPAASSLVPFTISEGTGPSATPAALAVSVTGGVGGANGGVTNPGQKGGGATITTGAGSNAGATSGTGGAGGDYTITTGNGGTAAVASTTGKGGDVLINLGAAGATGTAGAPGQISIVGQPVQAALTTPLVNMTQTWNTTGAVNGILANFTDTAQATGSAALNLQLGGVNFFKLATQAGTAHTLGPNITIGGTKPTVTLPGTTPYLNMQALVKGTANTCTFALTTSTFTLALSPVSLCTYTLPATAVTWYWVCDINWSNVAGTTPTYAIGVTWAQAPSAPGQSAWIDTTNALVGTAAFTATTTNANILATGTLTNSATVFLSHASGTFTGSATSGTFSPTVSLTGTSATGTAVGGCTIQ